MNYASRWSETQKDPLNWFFFRDSFRLRWADTNGDEVQHWPFWIASETKRKQKKEEKERPVQTTMCVTLWEKEEAKSSSLTFSFRIFTQSKIIMQYGSIFDYARGHIHENPLNVFIIHVNVSRTNVKYSNMSRIRLSSIAKVNISCNGVVACEFSGLFFCQ